MAKGKTVNETEKSININSVSRCTQSSIQFVAYFSSSPTLMRDKISMNTSVLFRVFNILQEKDRKISCRRKVLATFVTMLIKIGVYVWDSNRFWRNKNVNPIHPHSSARFIVKTIKNEVPKLPSYCQPIRKSKRDLTFLTLVVCIFWTKWQIKSKNSFQNIRKERISFIVKKKQIVEIQ